MENYEPNKEEIDLAIESAKKQMADVPEAQAMPGAVNEAMGDIAKQMGDTEFDSDLPATVPEEELIREYESKGWTYAGEVQRAEDVEDDEDKVIRCVAYADKYLVFERENIEQ